MQGAALSVLTALGGAAGPQGSSNTTAVLPVKNVSFAGNLGLDNGVEIKVGPAVFQVQRAMQWTYDKNTGNFTTRVTMSGSGTVVVAAPGQATADGPRLECVISGDMDLQATAFPGV
jgi:hypothetical protein